MVYCPFSIKSPCLIIMFLQQSWTDNRVFMFLYHSLPYTLGRGGYSVGFNLQLQMLCLLVASKSDTPKYSQPTNCWLVVMTIHHFCIKDRGITQTPEVYLLKFIYKTRNMFGSEQILVFTTLTTTIGHETDSGHTVSAVNSAWLLKFKVV